MTDDPSTQDIIDALERVLEPPSIYVSDPHRGQYWAYTLAEAVRLAGPGTTIFIPTGVYKEAVTIGH